MFERYTEKARRIIFFARYEASLLGSPYIEPEHLLLGLCREDKALSAKFIGPFTETEAIRKRIEDTVHHGEKISVSVGLPMSKASKSVLARAEEERAHMGAAYLGTEHVLLGLLQQESLAAGVLRERGVKAQPVRDQLQNPIPPQTVQKRPTACKDCKHLIVDGEPDSRRLNLFCGASPIEPEFDCYTGEFKPATDRPGDRYRRCVEVNFGDCRLFEPKQ